MVQMGFEPTPPKRLELESSALDRSASEPSCHCGNIVLLHVNVGQKNTVEKKSHQRDSNP